jgi:hypothetical protein
LELRVLRRTVVLECYANMFAREALRGVAEPLENMMGERAGYALEPDGVRAQVRPMRLGWSM